MERRETLQILTSGELLIHRVSKFSGRDNGVPFSHYLGQYVMSLFLFSNPERGGGGWRENFRENLRRTAGVTRRKIKEISLAHFLKIPPEILISFSRLSLKNSFCCEFVGRSAAAAKWPIHFCKDGEKGKKERTWGASIVSKASFLFPPLFSFLFPPSVFLEWGLVVDCGRTDGRRVHSISPCSCLRRRRRRK